METYRVKWQDHQEQFTAAFKYMRSDEDFTDITLVCKGNVTIRAHRIILSSCSTFFKVALARRKKIKKRILFLTGISSQHLEYVLDFIYNGEVFVVQDELQEFLAVAEDLKLRGIVRSESKMEENVSKSLMLNDDTKDEEGIRTDAQDKEGEQDSIRNIIDEELIENETESHTYAKETLDIQESTVNTAQESVKKSRKEMKQDLIQSQSSGFSYSELSEKVEMEDAMRSEERMMERGVVGSSQKMVLGDIFGDKELNLLIDSMIVRVDGLWACEKCGKKATEKSKLKGHIEGIHITGLSVPCNLCGNILSSRKSLGSHTRKFHRKRCGYGEK